MIKRTRILLGVLLCFNLIFAIASPVSAQAERTDAEEGRTLTVSSAEQLIELSRNCMLDSYSHNLTVYLDKDIDLSGSGFSGIPTFNGTFDGGGHTVSGLNIDTNGSVQGMFRYLRPNAEVRNLNVEGIVAPGGSHRQVGGLAGRNAGKIVNCSFSGEITGADCIGGLVGLNELTGIIEDCTVSGQIHGDHFIGGVAGENRGVIRRCHNKADINAYAAQNSVEIGDISIESLTGSESAGTATDIGGISGTSSGVIRSCTNSGTVGYRHIGYNVGGISGSQTGYISECTNYGAVYARKEAGGIVGQMEPSVLVSYDEDTLQLLHGQLTDMSGMLNSTSSTVQNGYGDLSNQAGELQGQIDNAMDAMGQLMPNDGTVPDPDSTNAALNNLGSAISGINGTINGMSSTSQDAVTELTDKLGSLIGQINAISTTLGNISQGVGGSVTDISDADTEEDTSGKVEGCVNGGTVNADINAGGIVGAMSIENDLDPENDFTMNGSSSLNFRCETRAVVLCCENRGTVSAKKQNAGGVAGYMMLGLVSNSGNTGYIDASAAKYVGGIVGLSNGFVRGSWAKCVLEGSSYVGGVAGQSDNTVTDCMTMTDIHSGVEKLGEVLGYADKLAGLKNEDNFARNYYLAVGEDAGGVDGISYDGAAQSMDAAQFFALNLLPDAFDTVTLTFVFEDGSRRVISLTPGAPLEAASIPSIPEKEGHTARWDGIEKLDLSAIKFDVILTAVYDSINTALQSDILSEDGKPVMLALGSFSDGDSLHISRLDGVQVIYDDAEHIESWEFSVTGDARVSQLRLRLPDGTSEDTDRIQISLRGKDETWRVADSTADGSYLVFAVEEGDSALQIDLLPEDYLVEYIAAGGSVLLLLICAATYAIKKRRSRNSATSQTNE